MNIISKDYLTQLMVNEELPFIRVNAFDGKTKLLEVNDDKATVPESIAKLEQLIQSMEDGQIIHVLLSNLTRKQRGETTNKFEKENYHFRVKCNSGNGKIISGTDTKIDSSIVNDKILDLIEKNKQLELKLQEQRHEQRYADLEKKIEEKNNESPLDKYMPVLINGLMPLLNKSGIPVSAGIAGTEEETPKQRITAAINKLIKIDKDFATTIECLATYAENNSAAYFSFIPILKQQTNG